MMGNQSKRKQIIIPIDVLAKWEDNICYAFDRANDLEERQKLYEVGQEIQELKFVDHSWPNWFKNKLKGFLPTKTLT